MSWLSKATGIHLGNIGAPVGALIGSVIPGVGTAIGAGLGQGLGALGSGKKVQTALGQGLVAGAGTKLAGALLGGARDGGGGLPGGLSLADLLKDAGGAASALGGLGGLGGALGGAASFLGDHGGDLLAGAQGVNAALLQKQSNDLANKAVGGIADAYNAKAPLRLAGIQGMSGLQTPGSSAKVQALADQGSQPPIGLAQLQQAAQQRPTGPMPMGLSQLLNKNAGSGGSAAGIG